MIVGFDIDGVLYPWHEHAYEWYKNYCDADMTYEDFWTVPGGFINKNEGKTVVRNLVYLPFLYEKVKVSSNVVNSVKRIDAVADEIYYITARPNHVHRITRNWIDDCGFPKTENLMFADEFEGGKLQAIKETNCTFYVEDRDKYIKQLSKHLPVLVINRPYNKNLQLPEEDDYRTARFNSIVDVADYMETRHGL